MIKKQKNTIEVFGDLGKKYDYITRVLASFAEIYHYDYSMSSLFEEESVRKHGILGRIRGFYDNHYNESEIPTKFFYQEVVFDTEQQNEYGFLNFKPADDSALADIISLAVRILEAMGMKDVMVKLDVSKKRKEYLINYLDVLDINYEEKEIKNEYTSDCSFQIFGKNTFNKEVLLIQGGDLSNYSKKVSGLSDKVFGFWGTIENLLEVVLGHLHLDESMLDVVVTYGSEMEKEKAYYLTQELRLNGFKTEVIKRVEKSFIKEHYNTKYVISMKEEEMKKDEVVLTDLYTKEKKTVKELDLIQYLDINF